LIILDNYQIYGMNNIPPSLGLVVAAGVTFARALWTREINFLAGESARVHVKRSAPSLNATAIVHRRAFRSRTVTNRSFRFLALFALAGIILFAPTLPRALAQDSPGGGGTDAPGNNSDYEGPVGVTGIFNGNITTACSYDPLTHGAKRTVTDIVVPGSVGKYPLKMTRYYNSRSTNGAEGLAIGWTHEYSWILTESGSKVISPQGSVYDNHCGRPVGVSEYWESGPTSNPDGTYNGTFRRADGGRVVFVNSRVSSIIDPYGLTTTITRDAYSRIWKVTEPGTSPRYLQFTYDTNIWWLLKTVEAHDGQGNTTDSVNYTYTSVPSGGNFCGPSMMLTGVTYSDQTTASYGYEGDNVPDSPGPPIFIFKQYPLLDYCNDVRYNGPMREIAYIYQVGGPHGAILKEKNPNVGPISTIAPELPLRTVPGPMPNNFTETRGDGPTRSFTYTAFRNYYDGENDPCLNYDDNNTATIPPQQMLQSYTDFQNQSTSLGYDTNWYVNSVTDANGHTTGYTHGPPPSQGIGQITQVTHPDGTTIQYTYDPDPHYIVAIKNERNYTTYYHRDANTHLIYQIDYPDNGSEAFTLYNAFGQVLNHQKTNGAWESFAYDGRGLLIDKWNPKFNSIPSGGDPHTHYTYYTSADGYPGWIDRVKTVTLPANISGQVASETYEYDRANGNAVAGRGLVTKITHADNTYQRFGYDGYGNKLWANNELGKQTVYDYDSYNRVRHVSEPSNPPTTYDYSPTQGDSTACYLHTTSSVYFLTDPIGIITANSYDPNFRKTSTTQGYRSTSPALTSFQYDYVGNLQQVTDPRGNRTYTQFDARNRKLSTAEAYGTSSAETTAWHYYDGINVLQIDRPDGTSEYKGYDPMNRVSYERVPKDGVPGNVTGWVTTQFFYYVSGMLHKVQDGNNHVTNFIYNAADLKTEMDYPDIQTNSSDYRQWAWDNAYNMYRRHTVNGWTQYFNFDNRNRQTQMRWTDNSDWSDFHYYADSRLYTANNANSGVTRVYDDAGRLTLEQQNLAGLGAYQVRYTPDADGRITHMWIPNGIYDQTRSYNDPLGRLSAIGDQWRGDTIQYHYDAASNVTSRTTMPNISQITSHITYVMNPYLNRIAYRDIYLATGLISSEMYSYDPMNRLRSVYRTEDGKHDSFGYFLDSELSWAQYGLTGPGSPTGDGGATDSDDPAAGGGTGGTGPGAGLGGGGWSEPDGTNPGTPPAAFVPDADQTNGDCAPGPDFGGAVIADAAPGDQPPADSGLGGSGGGSSQPPDLPNGRTVTYNLDKAGNRTSVNDSGNNAVYTPDILNRYGTVGSDTVSNGDEHQIAAYQTVNYTYINDTHLVSVSSVGNNYALAYDALGRCVKRTLNNATTYYIYDGEKPIQEIGPAWASNIYGIGVDEPVIRFTSSDVYYFYQDHEGSVTHVAYSDTHNNSGLSEQYRYDVFGAPTIRDGSGNLVNPPGVSAIGNRFMFTGREWAPKNLGFYEYRAIAYHPGLGRFMSEDPKLFDAGDYNLYRYCDNDPEDHTDPMGTTTGDDHILPSGDWKGNT
jgi:RHS repeat-associated protein